MAEIKTKVNDASVAKFLNAIADDQVREDCWAIAEMMQKASKTEPRMWGSAILGFGSYHYKYASGHEGDAPRIGFSPRKQNITLYLMCGLKERQDLFEALGKSKCGVGCLYIKRLSDVHVPTLKKLIKASFDESKKMYPNDGV